jgi:CRP/FNR family transcriptional regulator, nitrogen oxide reductase regulator
VPLLRSLDPAEKKALAPICRFHLYARGDVVFAEGELATELSFVVQGHVKIVKAAPGRSVILRILGPGAPIGLTASFESRPYPGTAIALEPATVLQIPERSFFASVDRHPEIVRELLRVMMQRQAGLTSRVTELTGSVEGRVARVLIDLAGTSGRREGQGVTIPFPLSRQDIADLAGTTVETAIRIMSRWGKEGLVTTHDRGVTIHDPVRLRKAGEEET